MKEGFLQGLKIHFVGELALQKEYAGVKPVWDCPVSLDLNPGQEVSNMDAFFFPENIASTGTFLFHWYNVNTRVILDSVTIVFNATQPVSIEEKEQESMSISIFPNPTTDYLNFKVNSYSFNSNKMVDIAIFDVLGNKVKNSRKNRNDKVSVQDLSEGAYYIQITADNNALIRTARFVVSR